MDMMAGPNLSERRMPVAKILTFDTSRTRKYPGRTSQKPVCEHKQVTASTVYRTVRCTFCGVELDPFDVLLDMLKACVPADKGLEEQRLRREMKKRSAARNGDDPSSAF